MLGPAWLQAEQLEGSFNVADKTAGGSASFAVMNGATVLESGSFTLTRLVAFQFYGCGEVTTPEGRVLLPSNFCGDRGAPTANRDGQKKNCDQAVHQSSARETNVRSSSCSMPLRLRYSTMRSGAMNSIRISHGLPGSYGSTACKS